MQAQAKTKFKKTPIGEIPEEWEVVKLGKIIGYIKGKKPRIVAEKPEDERLPYLSTEYLRNNNPNQFVKITGNEIIVEDGDILLLWDGSNAGEFFLAKKGVLSSTMVKLSLKKDVYDKLFLFYLLKYREPFLKGQTKGTGIPHVDKNVLNALLLPLPPLLEQKKIAEILRTVDGAIKKTDEAIERTERLKKGLMQRLLTRGIKHERFKKTELGEIPEEWTLLPAEKVCTRVTDGTHDTPKPTERGYYLITSRHLKDNEINFSEAYFISEEDFKEVNKRSKVDKGDVLFSMIGTVGITAVVKPDYPDFAIKNVGLFKTGGNFDLAYWLYYYFQSPLAKRYIKNNLKGSTQKYITLKALRKFPILLPPLSEQKQIAEILSTVDRKLELLRQRRERLERVKRGLMRDLLTGRRRVKVE